ncbi:hypothetical protein Dimus_013052, partial [Dionaea muscipula]
MERKEETAQGYSYINFGDGRNGALRLKERGKRENWIAQAFCTLLKRSVLGIVPLRTKVPEGCGT